MNVMILPFNESIFIKHFVIPTYIYGNQMTIVAFGSLAYYKNSIITTKLFKYTLLT